MTTISLSQSAAGIKISFPYSPALVASVKSIPGRRFDGATKTWLAPTSSADAVKAWAAAHGWVGTLSVPTPPPAAKKVTGGVIPGFEKLFPYQAEGVEYLSDTDRAILGDEQGLGKTAQIIATLSHRDAFPAVIVCPASLKLNWRLEWAFWHPGKTVQVVKDGKSVIDTSVDVTIINYELVGKHVEALKSREFLSIACDESHYLKEARSARTKAVKELAACIQIRILASGTPIVNRPFELVSQLDILGKLYEIGGSWESYVKRYCAGYQEHVGRGKYAWVTDGASNLAELHEKLRKSIYLRRKKADVLKDLPEKLRSTLRIELAAGTAYDKIEKQMSKYLTARRQELLSEDPAMRSDAEQGALEYITEARLQAALGKIPSAKEWIESFISSSDTRKLVVMAHHRPFVQGLLDFFPDAVSISGDQSGAARQAAVEAFQTDPSVRLIICNMAAAGVGLTLTAADTMLVCEYSWTPGLHAQVEDRIHRIGQRNTCEIIYLHAEGSIDDSMSKLLEKKRLVCEKASDGTLGDVAAGAESQVSEIVKLIYADPI